MKKLVSTLVLFTACLALSAHQVNQHWKKKFEKIWRETGTPMVVKSLGEQNKLNKSDLDLFIFLHKSELSTDRENFFKQAYHGDTSDLLANKLNISMNGNKAKYANWMQDFVTHKTANSATYTEWKTAYAKAAPPAPTATHTVVMCENVDFEYSGNPWYGWLLDEGFACDFNENSMFTCNTFSDVTGSPARITMISSLADDPTVGSALPMIYPGSGSNSLRLENYANGAMASRAKLTFTVDPDKPYYVARYAVVLEDPGNDHPKVAKPFFIFRILDGDGNTIDCSNYRVFASSAPDEADPSFVADFVEIPGTTIKYRPWTRSVIPLQDYVNQEVTVEYVVSDCAWGGHLGYAYIDGDCLDGSLAIGDCEGDGTRELTAPDFFDTYMWGGVGIIGETTKNSIVVSRGGNFKAMMFTNAGCSVVEKVVIDPCPQPEVDPPCSLSAEVTEVSACNGNSNLYSVSLNINLTGVEDDKIIRVSVDGVQYFYWGPFSSTLSTTITNLLSDGNMHTITIQEFNSRFTTAADGECLTTVTYTAPNVCWTPEIACENCIGTFAPTPGSTYVISLWLKDNGGTATTTSYADPYAEIIFSTPGGPVSTGQIFATGKIIEGWQRVYYEFTIPAGATDMTVKLGTNSVSNSADFDDIRVYPVNGSMKSYVYDPISMKLVAVLDENNYATLYEYDQEGSLVRTKKETERGVVTISENRQNNPKR